MCNTKVVAMFNMRFDVRMMEYHGYIDYYNKIQNAPEEKRDHLMKMLVQKQFIKYDMAKVNIMDVQALVYLVDTNVKFPSLKDSEEWYLGWRGASFEQTISKAENENAVTLDKEGKIKNMNFFYLTPEEAYEYAAVDALGTYLLGVKLKPFLEESRISGQLDIQCLQSLERFENELTLIDTNRLEEYHRYLTNEIEKCKERCYATAGEEFLMGSTKECNRILKKLNIHTGTTTKRGEMSVSKKSIQDCLARLKDGDPAKQFLQDLQNYATLSKQRSSYVENTLEMCRNSKHHPNRIRFSYKTTEVPSGRLAAGGDKKNQFFAGLNIQNITKPKTEMHFCQKEELVKQYYPEVIEVLNASGTREEGYSELRYADTTELLTRHPDYKIEGKRYSYRILGWVFSDKPWFIPGEKELVAEGFKQKLNIRSAFLPDDNYYWVSIDFNAEELRIPTLMSKEPVWMEAFMHNKDVHKQTALSIWGEENYDKNKRKIAKSANFGILYGQNARNFAETFKMSIDEAEKFVSDFKSSLSTLFKWVTIQEKVGEKAGVVYTLFGRPRRVKCWFESNDWSWISFAKRTCVNTIVQGTGADILKIVMIRLFNQFYNTKVKLSTGESLTDLVRFKSTIHDEINYQVRKDIYNAIVPKILKIMRVQQPDWEFPMEVGLSYGNRWGQSVDFKFDTTTLKTIEPKYDEASEKDISSALGISKVEEVVEELMTYEEASLGMEDLI